MGRQAQGCLQLPLHFPLMPFPSQGDAARSMHGKRQPPLGPSRHSGAQLPFPPRRWPPHLAAVICSLSLRAASSRTSPTQSHAVWGPSTPTSALGVLCRRPSALAQGPVACSLSPLSRVPHELVCASGRTFKLLPGQEVVNEATTAAGAALGRAPLLLLG